MQAFGVYFDNKPLPLHYYLGIDARVNPLDEIRIDGHTFYEACANGQAEIVTVFLLSGFDINSTEVGASHGLGYTGLHYAAGLNHMNVLELLCSNGANIDAPSSNGGLTPLMLALASPTGNDMVRALLAYGADPRKCDENGDPAIFYAARNPVALQTLKTALGSEISELRNHAGETLLHQAARYEGTRYTILYVIENCGFDVNAKSNAGDTALHIAAAINDVNVIKALMSKGANPNLANNTGTTPLTVRGNKHAELMTKCAKESNKTNLERMTRCDASNLGNIDSQQIRDFSFAFIVPNVIMYSGSFLPTYLGVFVTFISVIGFGYVAQFALAQKDRNLSTAGWFSGALTFGSYVLITRVFPVFERKGGDYAGLVTSTWWIATALMYGCYAKAVLADPGVVHSSPDMRKSIVETVARDGDIAVARENFDMTTFVRKPLRSKHCNKTHFTVLRFDHYCVWTGNAIGAGNHRPFVLYCLCQVVSQLCVMLTTFSVVFKYLPEEAGVTNFGGLAGVFAWMFNESNTLVTYFLIFYNSFVFLFVGAVVFSQLWYASRNVTSNEVWFADRYTWMFLLGTRAYSLYDQGFTKNLVDFFWSGNLMQESYVVPKMNEHLATKTRQYAAKVRSAQAGGGGGKGGDSHGHSHGGQPCHGHGESNDVPTGIASGVMELEDGNNAAAAAAQTPTEAFTEMQAILPKEKQTEMQVLQGMLQEMVAGADEPNIPDSVDASRRPELLRKVKMMHRQYQAAMRSGAAVSSPVSKHD